MASRRLLSTAVRSLSLDGVFIPLTTPFSPATRDIDYEKLNFNLYKYKDVPFADEGAGDMSGQSVPEVVQGTTSRHFRRLNDVRYNLLTKQSRSDIINNTIKVKLQEALLEVQDYDQLLEPPPAKRMKTSSNLGYVVAGSNGEAPYLRPEERVELVRQVRQTVDKTKSVIGGATHESTRGACELSKAMARVGADGVLVMLPFYFKKRMTVEAIHNHYTRLADESPVPVVIYNMPFVTGIDIPITTLAKLAHHPNIRGVKDGDVRKLAGIVMATKGIGLEFDVLAGSAGYLLPSIQVGCSGGINGLAGALGKQVCELYKFSKERKWEEALKLHLQLTRIDTLLMSELGVPGLKAAMDLLGLYGGPCREPMLPSSTADIETIKSTLQQDNLI